MARKKSKSKRLAAAQEAHAAFLRKHGLNTGKPRLCGVAHSDLSVRETVPTSDMIPGSGKVTGVSYGPGNRVIGQPYNKGPLMVLSDKSELANAKRRDR